MLKMLLYEPLLELKRDPAPKDHGCPYETGVATNRLVTSRRRAATSVTWMFFHLPDLSS